MLSEVYSVLLASCARASREGQPRGPLRGCIAWLPHPSELKAAAVRCYTPPP